MSHVIRSKYRWLRDEDAAPLNTGGSSRLPWEIYRIRKAHADGQMLTTFHPWPRLPDELKLEVLSHLLAFDFIVSASQEGRTFNPEAKPHPLYLNFGNTKNHLFNLMATRNYNMASLAQEAYYKQNAFEFWLRRDTAHICPWPTKASSYARMIRNVCVTMWLDIGCTLDELLSGEGRWLFRPIGTLDREATASSKDTSVSAGTVNDSLPHTAFQPCFEALDVLFIKLQLVDEKGREEYGQEYEEEDEEEEYREASRRPSVSDRLEALTELMNQVEPVLQAKEVLTDVRMFGAFDNTTYDSICSNLVKRATITTS